MPARPASAVDGTTFPGENRMLSLPDGLLGRSAIAHLRDRLRSRLARLRSQGREAFVPPRQLRRRFEISNQPDRIYAIGDMHGRMDKLRALESVIVADCEGFTGSKLIVCLGDYIDKGPDSAAVVAHLMKPPPEGFYRICLSGNHEEVLIDVVDGRLSLSTWLRMGGGETLLSYGYDVNRVAKRRKIAAPVLLEQVRNALSSDHVAFLRKLPSTFSTPQQIFVHAGLRPGVPFVQQTEKDLLWIRSPFLHENVPSFGKLVVHGHTPAIQPFASAVRVNVDTGAYHGGPLTAARLEGGKVQFLSAM